MKTIFDTCIKLIFKVMVILKVMEQQLLIQALRGLKSTNEMVLMAFGANEPERLEIENKKVDELAEKLGVDITNYEPLIKSSDLESWSFKPRTVGSVYIHGELYLKLNDLLTYKRK